jgi:hypothetical protein
MSYPKGKARMPDDNPLFNMLVYSYTRAFKLAETGDAQAREQILCFFSPDAMTRLYKQGFITWKPGEMLEATPTT